MCIEQLILNNGLFFTGLCIGSFLGVICFSHKYISSSSLIESTFSLLEEDSTYSSSNIYNTGYDYSLNLSSELDLLPLNLVNLVEIIPLQNTVLGSP